MLIFSYTISFATAVIEYFTTGRNVVIIPYALIVPLVLIIPRILARTLFSRQVTRRWLLDMERLQCAILLLNAPASLWLHQMGFQYDRFLHFWVGVLCVPWFYLMYVAIRRAIAPSYTYQYASITALVCALGVVSVFSWEWYQHTVDTVFGTALFHDAKQLIIIDFWEDIAFGLFGMLAGLYLLSTLELRWRHTHFQHTQSID